MELLFASATGLMTASGIWLVLQRRTFPVIVGLAFLSYAVNFFLFASGRLAIDALPIVGASAAPTDPLPQALVLTAIVISFGMTAVVVLMALGAFFSGGHDRMDLDRPDHGENRP